MSSIYVRDQFKQFITTYAPTEKLVDMSARFEEIKEMLANEGISADSPWLGIDFVGSEEVAVALAATNDQGLYREIGAVYLHIVDVARLGGAGPMLERGETLRNLLRGRRLGDIVIESVSPMNFGAGATLQFEGGFMSGSFIVGYERDLQL